MKVNLIHRVNLIFRQALRGQPKVDGNDVAEGNLAIFARNGEFIALEPISDAQLLLLEGSALATAKCGGILELGVSSLSPWILERF